MKTSRLVGLVALGVAMVCGCTPDSLPKATVASVESVCIWVEGKPVTCRIGEKEQALLRDEFEKWQQAGFGGFEISFLSYTPSARISGKLEDGMTYSVDLGTEMIVVNETDANGKSSSYERMIKEADKRFFIFLLSCIKDGKIRKASE